MKQKIIRLFYIFIVFFNIFPNDTTTPDECAEEMLSMKVKSDFDKRFDGNIKEFYFFKGDKCITQREFEFIVKDDMIRENKRKLKKAEDVGFGTAIALGGLATAFLIPSVIFVSSQLTYFQNYGSYYSGKWIDYYTANYDSVILPGLINIGLTFLLSLSVIIDLAVTFSLINKYKYNEMMYRDVIDRYNHKLKKRYSIVPDISFAKPSPGEDAVIFGFKMKL